MGGGRGPASPPQPLHGPAQGAEGLTAGGRSVVGAPTLSPPPWHETGQRHPSVQVPHGLAVVTGIAR
eukprot:12890539-Prorocentrum_lima.AAC.1